MFEVRTFKESDEDAVTVLQRKVFRDGPPWKKRRIISAGSFGRADADLGTTAITAVGV